jgi:hypothetical protein
MRTKKLNHTRRKRRTQKAGNPYTDFLAKNKPPKSSINKYRDFIDKKLQSQKKRKYDTFTRGY